MKNIVELKKKSINIRLNVLKAIKKNNCPHIWSSYSVIDILNFLYSFKNKDDKIILSKWHASSALYWTLAEYWYINQDDFINNYSSNWSSLWGHVTLWSNQEISATAWALWHWLSIWIGRAIWNKDSNIYVILWDWELNEWSVWEAFMFISHHKIKNITIIIDSNKQQWWWNTKDIIDIKNFDKISADFWFNTIKINGNDYKSLNEGFNKIESTKTNLIIANTIKWYWISYMENNIKFHYMSPNDEEYKIWLAELNNKLWEI